MFRKWDKSKPPRGHFTLNRDCEQAQGLSAWYPFGNKILAPSYIYDLKGTSHLTGMNTPSGMLGRHSEGVGNLAQASSEYYTGTSFPSLAGSPVSLTGWASPDTSTQTVICAGGFHAGGPLSTTDLNRIVLVSGKVRANSVHTNGTEANAITTASFNAGAWNLFGATFASTTSRTVYLNGENSVNNTTSIAVGTLTDVYIGAGITTGNAVFQFLNGQVGECGVWNIALSPEIHQRLFAYPYELWYPLRSPKWISIPAAVGGTAVPVFYHHYQQARMS